MRKFMSDQMSRIRGELDQTLESYADMASRRVPGSPTRFARQIGNEYGIPARVMTRVLDRVELLPDAESSPPGAIGGTDTLYLNLRSILQIMTFLSKGVCVPEEHVRSGLAPMTPGPDGRPFDWTGVTAGHFFVASQRHRPRSAEVAVWYRGYWFFIRKADVDSRSYRPRGP